LSNFVADPVRVIGFDPYARLADYLIQEAVRHEAAGRATNRAEKNLVTNEVAREVTRAVTREAAR